MTSEAAAESGKDSYSFKERHTGEEEKEVPAWAKATG